MGGRDIFKRGRLEAQSGNIELGGNVSTGLQKLNLDEKRDGLIYVPAGYNAGVSTPLVVMLHGAGGNPDHGISLLKHYADANNIILLAPASRLGSWDIISSNGFGVDVIFINQSLTKVFKTYNIDTTQLCIGGFSDGASYALCIGLSNGDLFTHIIAFSPGFAYTEENHGKPNIFISHGVQDHILPIGPCSRGLVPRLRKLQYEVVYEEFDGEHTIPAFISEKAVKWFLG